MELFAVKKFNRKTFLIFKFNTCALLLLFSSSNLFSMCADIKPEAVKVDSEKKASNQFVYDKRKEEESSDKREQIILRGMMERLYENEMKRSNKKGTLEDDIFEFIDIDEIDS